MKSCERYSRLNTVDQMLRRTSLMLLVIALSVLGCTSQAPGENQVVGTWRMVSAQLEQDGTTRPAYGEQPSGMLSFTADMHYVEVLTDGGLPRFGSDVRGRGPT